MKNITFVFAHPDDESFIAGGTIAKYARLGREIDLICATRGEAGSWGDVSADPSASLGDVRQAELEKAARILGVSTVTVMDYKDGTLVKQTPGEIEDKLYKLFIEIQPDIVVTFDPTGITNHPDHVKISLSATFAFQKYAKQEERNRKEADNPKLYYVCMPQSAVDYFKKEKILPADSFGKPWRGTEDRHITTVIDVAAFVTKKAKALWAHETQRPDVVRYFALPTNPMIKNEYFRLRMHGTKEAFMGKNDTVSHRL